MRTHYKPGTLVRIVKSEMLPESVGWIVVVAKPTMSTLAGSFVLGTDCTRIQHPPLGLRQMTQTDIPTQWLKPIADPDEDAVDEMIGLAGKAPQVLVLHNEPGLLVTMTVFQEQRP